VEHIVVDLEATCWDPPEPDRSEIVEIGAVRLDSDLDVAGEFESFVRPVAEPELSPFCRELTTITQAEVDAADPFPAVFPRFLAWIGSDDYRLCSWGFYDVGQFRRDCTRHGLPFPEVFESHHLNVKEAFAAWRGVDRSDVPTALGHLGLPFGGTHHRGIDDARNIARIAQALLRAGVPGDRPA
jgi:3'-5' exoribonuclease 1